MCQDFQKCRDCELFFCFTYPPDQITQEGNQGGAWINVIFPKKYFNFSFLSDHMVLVIPKYIPGQLRTCSSRFSKKIDFSVHQKIFLHLHAKVVARKNEILASLRVCPQGQKRPDHPKNAIFQSLRYCHHNQTWGKDTSYLSQFGPKNILRPLPPSLRQFEKFDPMEVLNSLL